MKKNFTLIIVAVSLFVSFGLSSKADADKIPAASVRLPVTPTPSAEITRIELDRNEIIIPCPPDFKFPEDSLSLCDYRKAIHTVAIRTITSNPKNVPLTYRYTISGGRIVGEGEKVVWDLKGVRPGKYFISASIDDGRGFGAQADLQQVEVTEGGCCCMMCVCPTLDVIGGGQIKAGENVTFSTKVSGGSDTSGLTYKWTVSQGEIIAGQGTAEITVKTTKEMSGTVDAKVEINGPGLCEPCRELIDSETATIIK